MTELNETPSKLRKIHPDLGFTPSYWSVSQIGDLPLQALGLHTYLMSLPDGWEISADRIARARKEGRDSIRRSLRDLAQHGLLEVTKQQNKKGQFSTTTSVRALPKSQVTPETENPSPVIPSPENQGPKKRDTTRDIPEEKKTPPLRSNGSVGNEPTSVREEEEIWEEEKPNPIADDTRMVPQVPESALADDRAREIADALHWGKHLRPNTQQRARLHAPIRSALNAGWTPGPLIAYANEAIAKAKTNPGIYVIQALTTRLPEAPARSQGRHTQKAQGMSPYRPGDSVTDPRARDVDSRQVLARLSEIKNALRRKTRALQLVGVGLVEREGSPRE